MPLGCFAIYSLGTDLANEADSEHSVHNIHGNTAGESNEIEPDRGTLHPSVGATVSY